MNLLGATAEEGRDGIVVAPTSDAQTLEDLVGVPVGTSLGTHQEYVVDMLFAQAGVEDVAKEEVKKVPIRYELLMEGQIEAAAMAEPWLTLAIHNGARLIADDTHGENISQEVLFASDAWLETEGGAEAMSRLLAALDEAVDLINEDRETWRDTLFEHAGVPEEIKDELYIDIYPNVSLPTPEMLDAQQQWMLEVGLLDEAIAYEDLVWEP
jgi:NitT/TauT family transport system substrate-binding protein